MNGQTVEGRAEMELDEIDGRKEVIRGRTPSWTQN